ncbi:bifunctional 3-oxoadipate enol-lactonase/4-carboxymuconolactone decarboxylase PcaDC [Rhodococcoides yunnanense]|uniref:bifunctional 3-oxoadipate enol-lactonase/4-carboxymuconolactone decarboxylase PcaDC n=1 Tax=Rhodococcoides yunnanense TaxID=278209 RepID=UPI00093418F1|nr:3-oxoadipate enol-lactonase [Rhodococcus yunnanensis]
MTVELSYELVAGPAGGAPTVVLIGSLGSDRSMWDSQIGALADTADVIALDVRGHGKSPVVPGPYSISELADDVLAVLDSLDRRRVHLVGLSLGGAIAQWIAVHRPARVVSLTLLCTSARFGAAQSWQERAAAVRGDGTESLADTVLARWFTPELLSRDPELAQQYRTMIASTSDEGYAACCDALAGWDGTADLGRIAAPTIVIAGAQDPSTPPSEMRTLADGIVGSSFHVVETAAHLANVEQAGEVTRLIVQHICGGAYDGGRRAAYAAGMRVRREVLGDAHVDRSIERTSDFTAPFQDFITRTAWGDIWTRDGLDHRTRRLLTLAILTAVGNQHELDMHIRAALRAGLDPDELAEVFLHTAVYAGVPNSNAAFAMADSALAEGRTT